MNRKLTRIGNVFIIGGSLLILAAALLLAYNLWENERAGTYSQKILQQLPELAKSNTEEDTAQRAENGTLPLYMTYPDREMPTVEIDGHRYIGRVDIPSADISLPVMNEWSYDNLKLAPCRYSGSAYKNSLIIAGHNYVSHFRTLKDVKIGDTVYFTDVDGNQFVYEVAVIEQLDPTDVEEMESGDWDLTLFTCTIGGGYRVTVRCILAGTNN